MSRQIMREPRWPAVVAMLAAGCLYWSLPEPLSVGPGWLLLAVTLVLTIPLLISNHRGEFNIARILTFAMNALITLAIIASLAFLIQGLPHHRNTPQAVSRGAVACYGPDGMDIAFWY